jgi:hypothetical protein
MAKWPIWWHEMVNEMTWPRPSPPLSVPVARNVVVVDDARPSGPTLEKARAIALTGEVR